MRLGLCEDVEEMKMGLRDSNKTVIQLAETQKT